LPMKTSSTSDPEILADSIAASMAIDPSLVAGTEESPPRKEPIGVRRADAITTALLISDV